jgi:hypothetical protein
VGSSPKQAGSGSSTTTRPLQRTTGSKSSTGWFHDLTIDARPREGVLLQGGLSTGRTTTDNCDLRAKLPEIATIAPGSFPRGGGFPVGAAIGVPAVTGTTAIPESQCHVDTIFLTQYKFLGTYLVPKIDVQFGVTFQATPGPEIFLQLHGAAVANDTAGALDRRDPAGERRVGARHRVCRTYQAA